MFRGSAMFRVGAYVTLYKDWPAAQRCVDAIAHQTHPIEAIFIVDNSPSSLAHQLSSSLIESLYCPENIGIAGGLHKGIEWADKKGYDFLWTFDQDSEPSPACLEQLLSAYCNIATAQKPIGMIAPAVTDPQVADFIHPVCFEKSGFRHMVVELSSLTEPFECDAPITSGTLISLSTTRRVDPPSADFFIDGVDFAYGLALREAGYHNIVVPAAKMAHRFGVSATAKLWRYSKRVQHYSALRYYYICRNHTHIALKHSQGWHKAVCIIKRLKFLTTRLVAIALFEPDQKAAKLRACLLGTYYGLLGRLDRQFHSNEPRID